MEGIGGGAFLGTHQIWPSHFTLCVCFVPKVERSGVQLGADELGQRQPEVGVWRRAEGGGNGSRWRQKWGMGPGLGFASGGG